MVVYCIQLHQLILVKLSSIIRLFFKITKEHIVLFYSSVRVPSSDNDRLLQVNQNCLIAVKGLLALGGGHARSWEFSNSKAFCGKSCVGADPWLFATTFLMRLTTHDKLSYMETESRFVFFMFPKGIKYYKQNQQIFIYI